MAAVVTGWTLPPRPFSSMLLATCLADPYMHIMYMASPAGSLAPTTSPFRLIKQDQPRW